MSHRAHFLTAVLLLCSATPPALAELRDGKIFDQGATFDAPAENAPEELARMAGFIGEWDVEMEIHQGGPQPQVLTSSGRAKVTYMNRGHSIMERTRFSDFDGKGHSLATLAFIMVDRAGVWSTGEANSWAEAITLTSGGFEGENLVLEHVMRPGGGPQLLYMRKTYAPGGDDAFTMTVESSNDGAEWTTSTVRRYSRRESDPDFFPTRDDAGLPAPDRPAEAGQFDFIVGEFDATHWRIIPGGPARWSSNATAVHVMDGYAVLEFDWRNDDETLPDAGVSILRIYNRIMRRWESLYLTNRNHQPLYFGGVLESDRIVLHPFDAQTAGNVIPQWIFFDVRPDAYRWKGLLSQDRGNTWNPFWAIDFQRKGTTRPDPQPVTEVSTTTADGVKIFGDHYRPDRPAVPTVVLFHQAGGDARGEYADIARRLQKEGYEVFAWDARGGGERFGGKNRTLARLDGPAPEGYCAAYPDLEAALSYTFRYGTGGKIFAVGSSYSAALVIRLAAEHGNRLAGVAAFSPASGRMEDCAVDNWLPKVEGTPILAFRPESELESAADQTKTFEEKGIEVFVAPEAVHGASMLHGERSKGDVEATWSRLLAFLEDPTKKSEG